MTEDDIISGIIAREKATFTNDATDRGGPTKYGITQATLSAYLGHQASIADVQNLTEETARLIYRRKYIDEPGFNQIHDDNLRTAVVDWGVNSGVTTPIKALQRLIGAVDDGVFGQRTALAVNSVGNTQGLVVDLYHARAMFIARLCQADPSQVKYLGGWTDRVWTLTKGIFQ